MLREACTRVVVSLATTWTCTMLGSDWVLLIDRPIRDQTTSLLRFEPLLRVLPPTLSQSAIHLFSPTDSRPQWCHRAQASRFRLVQDFMSASIEPGRECATFVASPGEMKISSLTQPTRTWSYTGTSVIPQTSSHISAVATVRSVRSCMCSCAVPATGYTASG